MTTPSIASTSHPAPRRGHKLRRTCTLVAAFALTGLALGPAHAFETVKSGTLTVASDLTYPPYVYFDNKVPAGFDADFSRLMAEKLDLKIDIVDTRFSDLVLGLRANRFDMVASALYVTPERAKLINYLPYTKTGSSLMVLKSSTLNPKEPKDLCGLKVSNIKAASWRPKVLAVADAECKGKIDMLEYPTSPEAYLALKSGAVDVMMEDAAVAHEMVRDRPDELRITSTELIYPIVIGLGLNQKNPELRDALVQALADATESGEYQALLDKYGLGAPTEEEIADSYASKP
ncbi:MAG: ABC transporter substrate-binding protein [Castellaniella sp.]